MRSGKRCRCRCGVGSSAGAVGPLKSHDLQIELRDDEIRSTSVDDIGAVLRSGRVTCDAHRSWYRQRLGDGI
ncbi:hypothetical protein NDU88_004567 [Pleurodeles waltl]|uniref:Uncharacterized protein n=1 Tax=Pleurodeles waltl TaxID=8319 RepID=A0AAV7VJ62_PLEWA|nr:hypothetical protein NDU88_004567 [Pleurodeles waltl]